METVLNGDELNIIGETAVECPMCEGEKEIDTIELGHIRIEETSSYWSCPCCGGSGEVEVKVDIDVDIIDHIEEVRLRT